MMYLTDCTWRKAAFKVSLNISFPPHTFDQSTRQSKYDILGVLSISYGASFWLILLFASVSLLEHISDAVKERIRRKKKKRQGEKKIRTGAL
jgi:hypothetical protein